LSHGKCEARLEKLMVSTSEEDNARYTTNLCRQLNLQLLVVLSLDQTHVVEP
jgi:hypothetical protein